MEKKKPKKEKINCFSACNELQISGRNRRVSHMKYGDNLFTIDEWKKVLKKDNLV